MIILKTIKDKTMNIVRVVIAIVLTVAISASKGYGQQTDSGKNARITYLKSLLKTDAATAGKVVVIQDDYKKGIKQVMANGRLNDRQKHMAIDSLMNEKNRKLGELLPESQRNQIIPTTERRIWKTDTTAKRNR